MRKSRLEVFTWDLNTILIKVKYEPFNYFRFTLGRGNECMSVRPLLLNHFIDHISNRVNLDHGGCVPLPDPLNDFSGHGTPLKLVLSVNIYHITGLIHKGSNRIVICTTQVNSTIYFALWSWPLR